MNDLVFDSENDDAFLAEHLKLSHSVMDPDLFNLNHSLVNGPSIAWVPQAQHCLGTSGSDRRET